MKETVRLVFNAIESEQKEKAIPLYMILKVAAMVLGKEDDLPPFEEFVGLEQIQEYKDPLEVTQKYIEIEKLFEKARE